MNDAVATAEAGKAKYNFLSPNFFRGSVKGQINSVWKDRTAKPEKVAEFKQALKDGDLKLGAELTRQQAKKLVDLGIEIPEGTTITSARRATAEAGEGSAE